MFNQETHSLVLRACREDMSSKNNFKWPTSGLVECPDWVPVPSCGKGLHGWLYGHGDGTANNFWNENDKWLVVLVETSTIVHLDGKVKFQKGEVLFCGDRKSATNFLMKHEPRSLLKPVIGAFAILGDKQTAITGDYGTSTSGEVGNSISGDYGISISGDYGTSTSDDYGKSTSGYSGTSISSYNGTSISGDYGTSTSGEGGKCKAGYNGMISIYYENNRTRLKVGYIGEDGLEPDTFYKLDENNNFTICE